MRKGELVTTAGLQNALFPAGIPVGRRRRCSKTPGDLDQRIPLRPLVDVGRLEFLDVLMWSGPRRSTGDAARSAG